MELAELDDVLIGFGLTPGYQTYAGLGGHGVLAQGRAKTD